MFDFIPVEIYTDIQYYIILGIVVVILLYAFTGDLQNRARVRSLNSFGWFFVIMFTLYMGQRQVSYHFGDTINYNRAYQILLSGGELLVVKDYLFNYMMVFSSNFMSVNSFFLLVDVLYIVPVVLFSRKYFGSYWFIAFIMFAGSFSFWSYGVNGLRNGLGTALFILALYFYDRKWLLYLCLGMSYFMHASLMIPIAAFMLSGLYKNPKIYLYIWVAAIPLSLAGGSVWTSFFTSLGFAEERAQGYLTGGEEFSDQFSQTGFRWDFLVYSSSAIFAGWYFIFKKKITDSFYIHVFGVYCITNAFWILVITAAFSNRFAYLSWFLMPAVIAYPMFRYKIWDNQYRTFSLILLLYFMFTFIMNVVL
ncbi:EpsG family protein [Chryseobacterium sp. H3056]|uniref:EpsG family protein n=1 Tax=Kaistella daneshvariae TaxID=2487074 RepID=A0A3N0WWS7_9FLAO|nr:EpsG family protein [Kaistella daneshvariae]ROI09221.1 EpsG family protein [Kaistella daneshvariae]